jgi:5'-3' exonuclease
MGKNRILLVDTSSILHTVKHGNKKVRKKDQNSYITFGFLLKLQLLMRKTRANVCVFARDSHPDTSIRKKIFPDYKEKRRARKTEEQKKLDAIAYPQFTTVEKEILPKMGYQNIFYTERLEADDIIGSVCKTYSHCEIIIATNDHDMYQLLTDNVCIIDPKTTQYFTKKKFMDKYNIAPCMWKRIKTIAGCGSDEVPGVPGVAEKTVLKFLLGNLPSHYKTYKAIHSEEGQRIINRNKSLIILPFRGTPEYNIKEDRLSKIRIHGMAKEYGFMSIVTDLENWYKILKGRGYL